MAIIYEGFDMRKGVLALNFDPFPNALHAWILSHSSICATNSDKTGFD
jgi:hypothetical protein